MAHQAAPFDVVEASRRVWLEQWDEESASGMAVFAAILRSYQLLSDQVNKVMRSHDLSFARYEVLTWLATDKESSVTLSWISRTLRIPPATVTNLIDRLEADGLIQRVTHPSDGRTTVAVITSRGRKLAADATRDLNATVYKGIGLSATKRHRLVDLLTELRASGNDFDVERSDELIADLAARHPGKPARNRRARSA